LQVGRDPIPLNGAEAAVPSSARVGFFGSQRERQARESGGAAAAAAQCELIGPSALRVVGVGVCPGAGRFIEAAVAGVLDQAE